MLKTKVNNKTKTKRRCGNVLKGLGGKRDATSTTFTPQV